MNHITMKFGKRTQGITLLELMIVVLIVGILSAIAYPSYRELIARSTRNEAKAALMRVATNQEMFYLQNDSFTTDLAQLGFPTSPFTTTSDAYVITVAAPVPNANYVATAAYSLTGEELNKCASFSIDATGAKTSAPLTNCWAGAR